MADDVNNGSDPSSPCVDICVVHEAAKICVGCYRTTDEIARWQAMSDTEKVALKRALPERAKLLKQRRGGRKARTES